MIKIMVNKKCKQYSKADSTTKRSIDTGLVKLSEKISSCGSNINCIFNTDSIVYDRINSEIFVYKCHGINNTQLRLIYGAKQKGNDLEIYLVDFVNKKGGGKQYINDVNDKFKGCNLSDFSYEDISITR